VLYEAVRFVIGGAALAFYRRVHLEGDIPSSGPALLVANHPNGLVDPAIVASMTPRRVRMLAKAPLFHMPVIGLIVRAVGALPVFRTKDGADTKQNDATFAAVQEALREGSCVLIFPEGISHDEPSLQPLKTGAARMVLAARAAGVPDIRVVPIGLTYRDKERFRSAVATHVGSPLEASAYADDDVRKLTDDIADALREVTVNLEHWEDLPLLEAVDAIWRIDDENRAARLKELADGVALLRTHEPDTYAAARQQVAEWSARLAQLGLSARDLRPEHQAVRRSLLHAALFTLRTLALVVVGLPGALFGALWFFVPFWLVHALVLIGKPTRDVAATVKVMLSVIAFPLWHALATVAVWRLVGANAAWLCGTLAPVAGMTSRWFFRGRTRALRDLAVTARLLVSRALNRELDLERDRLIARFDALGERVKALRDAAR
jgi:glycerol-3-phosphate O-acyltransferase / dihydroxyacetone phosphate acyltransferase